MFKEMDSRFMHWVLQAILDWEPTPLEGVRVFQIHGAPRPADSRPAGRGRRVIPDGGHLINVTHAKEVNAFLRRAMESCVDNVVPVLLPLQRGV